MAQKRQRQTFEKLRREQALREKRLRKQERKEAARAAKEQGDSTVEHDDPNDTTDQPPIDSQRSEDET